MSLPKTVFETAAWRQVKAYAEARLATLRVQNDALDLTEAQTAHTRGAIKELKTLIALDSAKPEIATRDIYHDHED
jgi:hypothetical protein